MSVAQFLSDKTNAKLLHEDAAQRDAALALDDVSARLQAASKTRSWLGKAKPAVRGLYMWGGVGRGKSMLMDVFYDQLPGDHKRRVHFHAFMQDVHEHIHHWRALSPKQRKNQDNYVRGAGDDPIAPTAKALAKHASVLCFDEFHVTDIADAMILSRLFKALFARGVTVIATSNRSPDTLYKDGLNRGLFLPFIELLKEKMVIHEFADGMDHRLRKLQKAPVYYSPLSAQADKFVDAAWARLIRPATAKKTALKVQGRTLTLLAASGTARASFDDLCGAALGAADYLVIARTFTTLIIEHIPTLGPQNRNEAKRFVTLVDALYESKTKLIISAAAAPDKLYQKGNGSFEFKRTSSRLIEMQSVQYLGTRRRLAAG